MPDVDRHLRPAPPPAGVPTVTKAVALATSRGLQGHLATYQKPSARQTGHMLYDNYLSAVCQHPETCAMFAADGEAGYGAASRRRQSQCH